MLISSRFHDYYDSAIGMGIDKTCVYDRKTSSTKERGTYHWFHGQRTKARQHLIGFCGKLYPVVEIEYKESCASEYYYNRKDLEATDWAKNQSKNKYKYFGDFDVDNDKGRKNFFENTDYSKFEKYFSDNKCPVFILEDVRKRWGWSARKHSEGDLNYHRLVLNPQLKPIKFMRIKDPYTAFQDIFMYISGVIGNTEKDTVGIDDKHMLKQKGFDKWSFKTMPGTKKPRRRGKKDK